MHPNTSGFGEQPPFFAEQSNAASIEATIKERTGSLIRRLRVVIEGNGITLSGTTSTYYAKTLANHAALDCMTGGQQLTNDIEVW